jgi:hypothetical protein
MPAIRGGGNETVNSEGVATVLNSLNGSVKNGHFPSLIVLSHRYMVTIHPASDFVSCAIRKRPYVTCIDLQYRNAILCCVYQMAATG